MVKPPMHHLAYDPSQPVAAVWQGVDAESMCHMFSVYESAEGWLVAVSAFRECDPDFDPTDWAELGVYPDMDTLQRSMLMDFQEVHAIITTPEGEPIL